MISVVVPCFNEEQVIEATHIRLLSVLGGIEERFELIYVDDGSRDGTLNILQRLVNESDGCARLLSLSRNFGHQLATTAGLDYARGDAVVLIDADLQDPPEVILEMISRWREGYDVAYGQRRRRDAETPFKLFSAKLFYRLINYLSDTEIPADTGDFRLMDRAVVEAINDMPERDRFLRGMVSWIGFKQIAVPYDRAARHAGESKYPLAKMIRLALDGIFSFSTRPMRLAVWTGLASFSVAMIGIAYAIAIRLFTDIWVSGWTFLAVAIFLMGGIQLLFLGIIGEYLSRIYLEQKSRPLYIVSLTAGFAEDLD